MRKSKEVVLAVATTLAGEAKKLFPIDTPVKTIIKWAEEWNYEPTIRFIEDIDRVCCDDPKDIESQA